MQRLRIGTRTVSHKPDSLDTPSDLLACRDAKTSFSESIMDFKGNYRIKILILSQMRL
jgi:hypothetical protein